MRTFVRITIVCFHVLIFVLPGAARAQTPQVTLASLAYSGDAQSIPDRFHYSRLYEKTLAAAGDSSYARIKQAVSQVPAPALTLTTGQIGDLKGRDQAIVLALVITSEVVSVERFGQLHKLLVLIRGQTLFFDFKSMAVIRAYPLSFAYIDSLDHPPTESETVAAVRLVYEGALSKPGIYQRFANTLAGATLPAHVPRYLKVSGIRIAPEVMAGLPGYLTGGSGVADTWAADLVGEAISTQVGIPIVPYTKGSAIGKEMALQVADGTVYTLDLPTPDYEISVDLTSLKKIKYGEVPAGASFIYGAYATIKIEEPLSGTVYLNTALKNGEVKVVPRTQSYVDDFPAYYDSLNGMFRKLAQALDGKDAAWIRSAAAAPDIDIQISKTKELMNLCK